MYAARRNRPRIFYNNFQYFRVAYSSSEYKSSPGYQPTVGINYPKMSAGFARFSRTAPSFCNPIRKFIVAINYNFFYFTSPRIRKLKVGFKKYEESKSVLTQGGGGSRIKSPERSIQINAFNFYTTHMHDLYARYVRTWPDVG